ncbi:hypothetical protein H9P43_009583 [Blastocladiella emersonii ATCC 22665]|nr:hypothetical protein H9P43_009583 [Blastocladiella emersonii ATCC 22665]
MLAGNPSVPVVRTATHAGSWYLNDEDQLDAQLTAWLTDVRSASTFPHPSCAPATPATNPPALPMSGTRVLVAPHAGFTYSGATAAWAYGAWDTAGIRRVLVLGPSHHVYLAGCALTRCTAYDTPLGALAVDTAATQRLADTGHFTFMARDVDEAEHSIELHLPWIAKVFNDRAAASLACADLAADEEGEGEDEARAAMEPEPLPTLVPILVGNLSPEQARIYGELLARELADPHTAAVISTDFCHWGSRFRFTAYTPHPAPPCACDHPRTHHVHPHHDAEHHAPAPAMPWSVPPAHPHAPPADVVEDAGWSARPTAVIPTTASPVEHLSTRTAAEAIGGTGVPLHASIEALDRRAMHLLERLDLARFHEYLAETKNTICGRNPLLVLTAALNYLYEASLDMAAMPLLAPTPAAEHAATAPADPSSLALQPSSLRPSVADQRTMLANQARILSTPGAVGVRGHAPPAVLPELRFVAYAQSSACRTPRDSSVSYAAAIVRLPDGLDAVITTLEEEARAADAAEREILRMDEDTESAFSEQPEAEEEMAGQQEEAKPENPVAAIKAAMAAAEREEGRAV